MQQAYLHSSWRWLIQGTQSAVNKTIITVTPSCLAIILAWEILWHGWLHFTNTEPIYVATVPEHSFYSSFLLQLMLWYRRCAVIHAMPRAKTICFSPGNEKIVQSLYLSHKGKTMKTFFMWYAIEVSVEMQLHFIQVEHKRMSSMKCW